MLTINLKIGPSTEEYLWMCSLRASEEYTLLLEVGNALSCGA